VDLDALTVLEVDDLDRLIGNDHRIPRSESFGDPGRKIKALLDVEVSAGNQFFQHHLDIPADMLKHFIHFIRSRLIYLVQQNPFSPLMGFRPLFCVRARLVGKVLFQPSARWALQPSVGAGRRQDRMLSLHAISAAFSISSAYLSAGTSDSLLAPNSFSSAFTCSRFPFRVSSASFARTCSRVTFGLFSSARALKASRLRFSSSWITPSAVPSSFVSTSTVSAIVLSASTRSTNIFTALSGI